MRRMILLLCVTLIQTSHAQQFRLMVASPIAGNAGQFKAALFVVRTEGCADPSTSRITATGEGLVSGARHTTAIQPAPLTQPGGYAINGLWIPPGAGAWVVNLTASCGQMTAGAIVPIGREGFLRDPSKFFPRPATPAEINEALRLLTANGGTK